MKFAELLDPLGGTVYVRPDIVVCPIIKGEGALGTKTKVWTLVGAFYVSELPEQVVAQLEKLDEEGK